MNVKKTRVGSNYFFSKLKLDTASSIVKRARTLAEVGSKRLVIFRLVLCLNYFNFFKYKF